MLMLLKGSSKIFARFPSRASWREPVIPDALHPLWMISFPRLLLKKLYTEDRLNILRGLVTGRYNFDDSFTTDDFSELLREVREGLILGETFDIDTEDEIEQDDEMLAISVIDDVDEDEENV